MVGLVQPAMVLATVPFITARLLDASSITGRQRAAFVRGNRRPSQFKIRLRGDCVGSSLYATQSLPASRLRWSCDPQQFDFKTTSDLSDLDGSRLLGQARAESAIEFGVGMRRDGYNLYVLGPPGAGKRSAVEQYLEKRAKEEPTPPDWCYAYNFEDSDRPKALRLPPGRGHQLKADLEQLIDELKTAIPAALDSEEHRSKVELAKKEILDEQESALEEISKAAKEKGMELIRTPNGAALVHSDTAKEMTEEKKKSLETALEVLKPKLRETIEKVPQLMKQIRSKEKELNREGARSIIEFLIKPIKKVYADAEDVVAHLDAVEADVVENSDQFHTSEDESSSPLFFLPQKQKQSFDKYLVNVLIDHDDTHGAPVVYEDHPYYHNLMGRIEHQSQFGSLVTDFSLIKQGALHRANGGYLVLQVRDVLLQPFAWEALKRALLSRRVQMESLGAELSLISTVSLQPEPIPLDVKVVLLGDRLLYYLLQAYDPDFDELFKVAADFSDEMDRSEETCGLYAKMLAALAKAEDAKPLDRNAVALMIEQAARQVSDQEKLSTHMRSMSDLLHESDYWAGAEGVHTIGDSHVQKAIQQQIYRSDRIRELVHEQIRRGTLLVDVKGERIGQVNGLSVMSLGSLSFGRPSRITATARMGRGKVLDIEREVDLGGSIHSKGVMILSSLLASRYARDCPLSLSASLAFEQSYGLVEGDSASVAECCALLSVLSGLPIRQGLALTGSLNQHGEAQPIGGVNEKIEGFFDICNATGLTGEQGVLIPESNAKHLMLRPDVVKAVEEGKFAVHTYEDVDSAICLLTGVEAGERDSDGAYPPDTVNFLVDRRLHELANLLRSFSEKTETGEESASEHSDK